MLFSNIHLKVLYPAENDEAWNFKTSFKRDGDSGIFLFRGMIEKARQDLETNRIIRQIRVYDRRRSIYESRGERHVIRLRIPTED